MKTNINEKAEKLKTNISSVAEKSKETIREIIDTNTKHLGQAIESNRKIVETIKEKLNEQEIENTVTNSMKNTFGKSIELAENTLDGIINSYTRQIELNIDYNTKLVDAVKESNSERADKLLNLIQDNFEASNQLIVNNTKEILDFYNKHTNLAVNFNRKFEETVNTQVDLLLNIQQKGLHKFNDWVSDWWKQTEKEVHH